jgi:hypothetical protein
MKAARFVGNRLAYRVTQVIFTGRWQYADMRQNLSDGMPTSFVRNRIMGTSLPMASRFAWIDIDEASRRTMLNFIDKFRDQGTLDELGIGTIRDAFADYFFPGTTTVQTRARYFLFVPWIYRRLEDTPVSGAV